MGERLGEALLDLDTNDKGLKKGIAAAEKDANRLGLTFDDVGKRAMAMGKTLGLAAGAAAVGIGVLVKRAIDSADAMSKAAVRAGVTTEEMSRLAWAGELADVSLGSLQTSLGRLSNLMAEMAQGGAKDTAAIFKALGIEVTDAEGRLRSTAEVLPEIADAIAGMEAGAERTALAMQFFGRSGAELIPMLAGGSAGLRDMGAEADQLGKTISTQFGQDAEQFNDTLTRIGAIVDGVALDVAGDLLPSLQQLAGTLADPKFAEAAKKMGGAVADGIMLIIDAVVTVMGWFEQLQGMLEYMGTHDLFGNRLAPTQMQMAGGNFDARRELKKLLEGGGTMPNVDSIYAGMYAAPAPAGPTAPPPNLSGLFTGTATNPEADKIKELVSSLQAELDVLRESDPVQQRMIQLRAQHKDGLGEQEGAVQALVTSIEAEQRAYENSQQLAQFFGDQALTSIQALTSGSKDLIGVINDLVRSLAQAVLQSMLLGQGPLAGVFGTQSASGGVGGLLGSLFSGMFATGGLIPNGTWGIVGERGPEPVIGTSAGAQVLPNSALSDMMGGGGRGDTHVTVIGSGLSQSELTQAIADALERFDRFHLPGRVAEINADPMARG